MKYLGKIDDIIFDGRLIVQTTFKPPLGKTVVNKHKQKLGKIAQIIGSVKKPHIILKPNKELKTTFDLIGTSVYVA